MKIETLFYLRNKIKGLIYGQAIGDALGLATEFLSEEQVANKYPKYKIKYEDIISDQHRDCWSKGEWTDDTDLFILTIQNLLENNLSVDAIDLRNKIKEWYSTGLKINDTITKPARGIGNTIRRSVVEERGQYFSQSNGAVMRIGGLACFDDIVGNTFASCNVTHRDKNCVTSCLFIVTLLHNILFYFTPRVEELINSSLKSVQNFFDTTELEKHLYTQDLDSLKLNQSRGYTYKPVWCAVYALRNCKKDGFYRTLLNIIRKGGDADTNACVVGAVIGSYLGSDKIEEFLVQGLKYKKILDTLIKEIIQSMAGQKKKAATFGWNVPSHIAISARESQKHGNYIERNKDLQLIYDYTIDAASMRGTLKEKQIERLIKKAPILDKEYTVFSIVNSTSRVYSENGEIIRYENLNIGDVFKPRVKVISATFDKSYPLNGFHRILNQEWDRGDIRDNVKLSSWKEIKQAVKRTPYKEVWKILNEELKVNLGDEYSVDDSIETLLYETRGDLKKKLKGFLRDFIDKFFDDFCCCCLLKIKLTNRRGLIIDNISFYPDQREILLPQEYFVVKNISREKMSLIDKPLAQYSFDLDKNDYGFDVRKPLQETVPKDQYRFTRMIRVLELELF